jgi:hypothetical protein
VVCEHDKVKLLLTIAFSLGEVMVMVGSVEGEGGGVGCGDGVEAPLLELVLVGVEVDLVVLVAVFEVVVGVIDEEELLVVGFGVEGGAVVVGFVTDDFTTGLLVLCRTTK